MKTEDQTEGQPQVASSAVVCAERGCIRSVPFNAPPASGGVKIRIRSGSDTRTQDENNMTQEPIKRCLDPACSAWVPIADHLPDIGQMVWLHENRRTWIGSRDDGGDGWMWGNSYGYIWHNGEKWDGDCEQDDDYRPTHWMPLPTPPLPNAADLAPKGALQTPPASTTPPPL